MKKNCDLSHDAITIVFSKYLIMNQHVSLKYRHERKQRMSSSRTSKPETLNDRSSKEVKTRQVQLTISQLEHITMPIMDNLGLTNKCLSIADKSYNRGFTLVSNLQCQKPLKGLKLQRSQPQAGLGTIDQSEQITNSGGRGNKPGLYQQLGPPIAPPAEAIRTRNYD
jgi:hypothetical protein